MQYSQTSGNILETMENKYMVKANY